VDFFKIIIQLSKIKQIKEEIPIKIVHFNNKIPFFSLKINKKSSQFKKDRIQNKIKNSLLTKIIKNSLINNKKLFKRIKMDLKDFLVDFNLLSI